MELSDDDIGRLVALGYHRDAFSVTDQDGVTRLRNVDGWCHFYDRGSARCRVYDTRPLGCYIYPVVFAENYGIAIDTLCPMGDTVSDAEMRVKGRILLGLLDRLDHPSNRQQ
jgi:Fe-S-cluster containining protein